MKPINYDNHLVISVINFNLTSAKSKFNCKDLKHLPMEDLEKAAEILEQSNGMKLILVSKDFYEFIRNKI